MPRASDGARKGRSSTSRLDPLELEEDAMDGVDQDYLSEYEEPSPKAYARHTSKRKSDPPLAASRPSGPTSARPSSTLALRYSLPNGVGFKKTKLRSLSPGVAT